MLSVSSSICPTTITATRIPFSLLLSSLSLTHFCSATTKRTVSRFHSLHFCFKTPRPPPPMPPSSSSKIIAEYAKSGRSSCKTCSNPIPAKALRLGSVSRDSRGFDMTKWYHFDCFSNAIESTEIIGGFDSLQSCDQEALRKLVDSGFRSAVEGVEDAVEGTRKRSSKIQQADEDRQETEQGELCSKKTKMSVATKGSELSVTFSTSDIKDNFKDATLLPKWKALQTIIFLERDDGLLDSNKIAAFDFDGCLAKTSVKRIGADAWSLMYPSIPDKLQSLYNDGYKLVIFTNESNIDRWKNKRQVAVDSKLGRLNNFIDRVKVPIQVFVACGYDGKVEDPFRKPKPGMWLIMEKHFNSGIPIDMDQAFYVGDAAGRASDHSDADIKFAEAVGLKFHLPEDYFGA